MESIAIGIAWCVAWGDRREPQFAIGVLQEMRRALCRKEGASDTIIGETKWEELMTLQNRTSG